MRRNRQVLSHRSALAIVAAGGLVLGWTGLARAQSASQDAGTPPVPAAPADSAAPVAPVAVAPTTDSWAVAIKKGTEDERARETPEERERREANAVSAKNAALDKPYAGPHFGLYASFGWISGNNFHEDQVGRNSGLTLGTAFSARYGFSRWWDLQVRAAYFGQVSGDAFCKTQISGPSSIPGADSDTHPCGTDPASRVKVTDHVLVFEATARIRPFTPAPVYVGLGGRVGGVFTSSYTLRDSYGLEPRGSDIEPEFAAVFELGTIVGSKPGFDLGARLMPMLGAAQELEWVVEGAAGWIIY